MLDVRTLYAVLSATSLVAVVIGWLTFRANRRYAGSLTWSFGLTSIGLGTLLVSLRGIAPDWLTIHAANYLVFLGPAALAIALRRFQGDTTTVGYGASFLLLVPAFFTAAWFGELRDRIFISSGGLTIQFLACTHAVYWRRKEDITFSEKFLSAGFMLIALLSVGRLLSQFRGESKAELMVRGGFDVAYLIGTTMLVMSLLAGFVLMVNERLERDLLAHQKMIASEKDELEALNTMKDKFFSIVAHDLRAPLASLMGGLELIVPHVGSERHLAELMLRQARVLMKFLENLLLWARSQQNIIHYARAEGTIDAAILEAVEFVRHDAASKNITLVSVPSGLRAIFDEESTKAVLRNLLSNAIKFTPRGGRITIQTSAEGETLQIRVADTGIGIPAEHLAGLFLIRRQSSMRGTEGETGSGLGLALCRDLAEKNDGRVSVESTSPRGTIMLFELPAAGDFLRG